MLEVFPQIKSWGKRTFGRKFNYNIPKSLNFQWIISVNVFPSKAIFEKKPGVAERALNLKSVDVSSRTSSAPGSLCELE